MSLKGTFLLFLEPVLNSFTWFPSLTKAEFCMKTKKLTHHREDRGDASWRGEAFGIRSRGVAGTMYWSCLPQFSYPWALLSSFLQMIFSKRLPCSVHHFHLLSSYLAVIGAFLSWRFDMWWLTHPEATEITTIFVKADRGEMAEFDWNKVLYYKKLAALKTGARVQILSKHQVKFIKYIRSNSSKSFCMF